MSRLLRRGFSTLKEARQVPAKVSKPLRVLFCGSDEFSSASLRALHAEHERNPELVKSIDVMLRPGKPSGRSLRTIREGILALMFS
jgi:methionyl-tRNA formyltransferase